ncbi:MAG: protein-glutamate O-methyltransferase [Pseudomonadota bacterium]
MTADAQTLSDGAFARLAAIAHQDAGLALSDAKRQMVQSRLARHLRRQGFANFDDYISHVEGQAGGDERETLISLLTTNVSSFFRESHHFRTLATEVLPGLISRAMSGGRVRIWSAGCSTGQEPYSIAMQTLSLAPGIGEKDLRILATDIDRTVLQTGMNAVYSASEADGVPDEMRGKFFKARNGSAPQVEVTPDARALVTFRQLNLVKDWPMKGRFDAIFCRNVVIYFDEDVQASLWPRFANALADGGWFFLGHSERLNGSSGSMFDNCGITTFRKRERVVGAA